MALNWQSLWEIRGREGLQDHVLQSARQILSGCCRGSQRRSLVQRRHLLGSRAVRWSCSSRWSRIPSHPRNDAGHLHLSASGRLCPPEGCDNCDPLATFCSRRGDLKAWLVFLTAKLAQGWQVPQISSWLLLLFLCGGVLAQGTRASLLTGMPHKEEINPGIAVDLVCLWRRKSTRFFQCAMLLTTLSCVLSCLGLAF